MEKVKIPRRRMKSPFWHPNPNPDFEPYQCGAGWCVSIQYLGVWKYKTKKDAMSDIPSLKNYRRAVLRQVEIANTKYFRKMEQQQEMLENALKEYHKPKHKRYGTKHLTAAQRSRLISMIQNGADEHKCKCTFDISSHVYAALKHCYGEQNENL